MLISPEYRALLMRQHAETAWGGNKRFRHYGELMVMLRSVEALSILDFGSGRESLGNHLGRSHPELVVYNYDPGTNKNVLPRATDVVVSCDVLEHVEPQYLSKTLETIFKIAQLGVYLVIALRQSGSTMVDGSPQHLIVMESKLWLGWLKKPGWKMSMVHIDEGYELRVWMTKETDSAGDK